MTFGLAPLARIAQAALRGSGREALAVAAGYGRLCRAVGREVMRGRSGAPASARVALPRDAASVNARTSRPMTAVSDPAVASATDPRQL